MKTIYITAIAAAALVLSGCNRDEIVPGASGDGYLKLEVAGIQTVTAVKGALINNEGQMHGAGVDNFMVAAWNNNTDCTGFVSLQEATYEDSKWSLEEDPVQWTGEDTKTFFAYANLPTSGATVTNTFKSDDKSQKLAITSLPTDARNQNDIMLGYYSGDGKVDGKDAHTAQIQFYHPLTAVKICDGGMFVDAINKITLSGIYASGTVDVTYKLGVDDKIAPEYVWGTTRTSYTSATLEPKSGDKLEIDPVTKVIGVPFVVIPQDVVAGKVRITLDVTVNVNESKTLAVDVPATTWTAGHTKSYTLSYGSTTGYALTITEWDENAVGDIELDSKDYLYEFKVADNHIVFSNTTDALTKTFQIESYRHLKGDDIIANREPVAYSAEYSIDGGDTWQSFDASATTATGISGLKATGNDGAVKETFVKLQVAARPSGIGYDEFIKRWEGEPMLGTESAPLDLSRMEIGGEGDGTLAQNTSNCYIVKHPGYYKIPCVYGNSIQNGTATEAGYKTFATGDQVLSTFLNAKGSISNAWVIDDVNPSNPKAAMIWCDYKTQSGNTLVSNVSLVNGGAGQSYIQFQTLSADELAPGNALLVLYDDKDSNGYTEGEALWSWHIWVTDADLSENNVGVYDSNARFMSRNLGWCEGLKGVRYDAVDDVLIRLVQQNSSNKQIITVSRPEVLVGNTAGASNLYYQQGRKEPFLGGRVMYDSAGNVVNYDTDTGHSIFNELSSSPDAASANGIIKKSVSYPFTFASNNTYDRWYYNLWSLNTNSAGIQEIPIRKTIYDPCPYGYRMPGQKAFSGFVYDAGGVINTTEDFKVTKFKNSAGEYDDNLMFPWAGHIDASDGSIKSEEDRSRLNICDYSHTVGNATNNHRYCIIFGPAAAHFDIENYADRSQARCVRPILEQ